MEAVGEQTIERTQVFEQFPRCNLCWRCWVMGTSGSNTHDCVQWV